MEHSTFRLTAQLFAEFSSSFDYVFNYCTEKLSSEDASFYRRRTSYILTSFAQIPRSNPQDIFNINASYLSDHKITANKF